MIFGHDWSFWVALIVATVIRVFTSPVHSLWRAGLLVLTSVFTAWVATDPILDILHLDPAIYKAAVGAVVALTADGIVRFLIETARNPSTLIDLWKKFRGSGSAK